jgi:hypothetical protein
LSTYNQWRMGLLAKNDIVQSWKSESIEINAVDVFGKPRAIFLRDGNSTYWLEFRSASNRYKGGLVIYRTDPPPGSSVVSPNPSDALQIASSSVGTDTWMLNLDSFTYSSSSSSSTGSMTLPQGEAVILHSGNISIQATPSGTSSAVVSITRNMKPSVAIPVVTPSSTWVSPNSPLLDRNYISNLNGIEQVEINVNGAVKSWTPQTQKDWKPTYLDPFTAPRIPVIQDLPEGQYEFTLRLKDMSGVWTSWSAPARANIDRGYPLIGKGIAFKDFSGEFVSVSLTDFKDEGSGLCLTQLINPDGWVTSRSVERINPIVNLRSNSVTQTDFETYDCLGNGQRGLIKSSMKYSAAEKLTRRGAWKTASKQLPAGSLQCVRNCQISLVTSGPIGIVVGSGSFEYELVGEKKLTFRASQKTDKYSVLSINSSQRKTLRITGKDFTLLGLIRGSISIDKVEMDQRLPNAIDTSLDSAAQRALSRLGFTSEDFSNGWSVLPMSKGTTLEDPSLDLCASDYLSESDRIERRQVVATKENSPYTFLSSEVVRYSSEFAAQKAIEELKQKYGACVANGGGKEKNGSFVKYSFLPIPENLINLVEENNRLVVHAKIGEGNSTRYLFAVYQFGGGILSGLYVVRPEAKPFSNEEITRWLYAASVIAKRMENSKRY